MCLREASDIGVAHAFKHRAKDIKPSALKGGQYVIDTIATVERKRTKDIPIQELFLCPLFSLQHTARY